MHFVLIPSVFFYFILIKVNTQTAFYLPFLLHESFSTTTKYTEYFGVLYFYDILKTTTLCLNVSATVAKEAFSVLFLLLSFATAVLCSVLMV